MKTAFKILFAVTALMVLLALLAGATLLTQDFTDMHVVINDEEVFLSGVGDWLGAGLGLLISGVVCLIVVPLVLLLGVALPLLIVGGVVAAVIAMVLGVGAVLGSPLILLALLLFVVLRNRSRANAARSSASV